MFVLRGVIFFVEVWIVLISVFIKYFNIIKYVCKIVFLVNYIILKVIV